MKKMYRKITHRYLIAYGYQANINSGVGCYRIERTYPLKTFSQVEKELEISKGILSKQHGCALGRINIFATNITKL